MSSDMPLRLGRPWRSAFLLAACSGGVRLSDQDVLDLNVFKPSEGKTEGRLLKKAADSAECAKYIKASDEEPCKKAGCVWENSFCQTQEDAKDDSSKKNEPLIPDESKASKVETTTTTTTTTTTASPSDADVEVMLKADGGGKSAEAPGKQEAKSPGKAEADTTPSSSGGSIDNKDLELIFKSARDESDKEGLAQAQQLTQQALKDAKEAEEKASKALQERNDDMAKLQNINKGYKDLEDLAKKAKAKAAQAAAQEAAIKVKVFKAAEKASKENMQTAEQDAKELKEAAEAASGEIGKGKDGKGKGKEPSGKSGKVTGKVTKPDLDKDKEVIDEIIAKEEGKAPKKAAAMIERRRGSRAGKAENSEEALEELIEAGDPDLLMPKD